MAVVELCNVRLRLGDSLITLGREFRVAPRDILAFNNIPLDRFEIDAWVMNGGGRRFAFDADEPFVATRAEVPAAHRARIDAELARTGASFPLGWAAFDESSVIKLPAGVRPCVDAPLSGVAPAAGGLFGLLLLALGAWAFTD